MPQFRTTAVRQRISQGLLFVCLVAFIPIGGVALVCLALGHSLMHALHSHGGLPARA